MFKYLYKFQSLLENNLRAMCLLIPFFLSLVISVVFYPGAMSFDSILALRGARFGVTDSMWPPMVSYIWSLIDLISTNPSLMHFVQVFLLLFSINGILFVRKIRVSVVFMALIFYLLIPVVLGTVSVIWKDVLMSSFLFAGLLLCEHVRIATLNSRRATYFIMAIISIFLGTCSRHNAVVAAMPIIFYLSFCVLFDAKYSSRLKFLRMSVLGSVLIILIFSSKSFLDKYSLPSFSKMDNKTSYFIRLNRLLDIAGGSVCTGLNLFESIRPNLSVSEIKSGYDPKHINNSQIVTNMDGMDPRIDQIWWQQIGHHPFCMLYNKLELAKYLVGADGGEQYLVANPEIYKNEFGYAFSESSFRDSAFKYTTKASRFPFIKPWFIYLLALICMFKLVKGRKIRLFHTIIFISGLLYLVSLILFGNAADARLSFYSTTAAYILIVLTIFEINKSDIKKESLPS